MLGPLGVFLLACFSAVSTFYAEEVLVWLCVVSCFLSAGVCYAMQRDWLAPAYGTKIALGQMAFTGGVAAYFIMRTLL